MPEIMNVPLIEAQGYKTYRDQKSTSEKTVPRVIRVIVVAVIDKYRPLVPGHGHFSTAQLFFDAVEDVRRYGMWIVLLTRVWTSSNLLDTKEHPYVRGRIRNRL